MVENGRETKPPCMSFNFSMGQQHHHHHLHQGKKRRLFGPHMPACTKEETTPDKAPWSSWQMLGVLLCSIDTAVRRQPYPQLQYSSNKYSSQKQQKTAKTYPTGQLISPACRNCRAKDPGPRRRSGMDRLAWPVSHWVGGAYLSSG